MSHREIKKCVLVAHPMMQGCAPCAEESAAAKAIANQMFSRREYKQAAHKYTGKSEGFHCLVGLAISGRYRVFIVRAMLGTQRLCCVFGSLKNMFLEGCTYSLLLHFNQLVVRWPGHTAAF